MIPRSSYNYASSNDDCKGCSEWCGKIALFKPLRGGRRSRNKPTFEPLEDDVGSNMNSPRSHRSAPSIERGIEDRDESSDGASFLLITRPPSADEHNMSPLRPTADGLTTPSRTRKIPFDRGTPSLLVIELIFSFLTAVALIVLGSTAPTVCLNPYSLVDGKQVYSSDQCSWAIRGLHTNIPAGTVQELVKLGFDVLIALVEYGPSKVHAITLKWALAAEGRLRWNSNMRLYTCEKYFIASNGLLGNFLWMGALVLAYSSGAFIVALTTTFPDGATEETPKQGGVIVLRATFLILMGSSLLAKVLIAALGWAQTPIPTWNSSSLAVVPAMLSEGFVNHHPGHCLADIGSSDYDKPAPYRTSMRDARHHGFYKTFQGLFPMIGLFPLIFATQGRASTKSYSTEKAGPLVGYAIVQSLLNMWLHTLECAPMMATDESTWRSAATAEGARASYGLLGAPGNIPQALHMVLVPAMAWAFSRVYSDDGLGTITVHLYLCFAFMGAALVVGMLFAFGVTGFLSQPKGYQPAAFGHIQTLANLVDDWTPLEKEGADLKLSRKALAYLHLRRPKTGALYWGHKSGNHGEICHAGTADHPLPDIYPDEIYK